MPRARSDTRPNNEDFIVNLSDEHGESTSTDAVAERSNVYTEPSQRGNVITSLSANELKLS